MAVTRLGAGLWIVAALSYFAAEAFAAAAVSGYGYGSDYISTLGVPGQSPHAFVMNAAFVVQGILFPTGAALVVHRLRNRKTLLFLSFAVLNGIGNLIVATVHSGAGNVWHPVGAVLAIAGGNAAVLAGASALRTAIPARTHRVVSVVLGVLGLLCLIALGMDSAQAQLPVGAVERGSVYSIYLWQTLTALWLLRRTAYVCSASGRSMSNTRA